MDYLINKEPIVQWLKQLHYYSLNAGEENQIQLKRLFQERPDAFELKAVTELIESIDASQTMAQKTVSDVHRVAKAALEKFAPQSLDSPFPRRTVTPPFPLVFIPIEEQSSH